MDGQLKSMDAQLKSGDEFVQKNSLKGWTLPYNLVEATSDKAMVELVQMEPSGDYSTKRLPLADILTEGDMHIRDFLAMENPSANSINTTDKVIMVAMSHVRLVLHPDKIYFFQIHRPIVKDLLRCMSQYLAQCRKLQKGQVCSPVEIDFGLVVLEGVLNSVAVKYQRRVYCLEPALEDNLQELRRTAARASRRTINRLLPLRNSLSRFEQANVSLLRVIEGLLNDDESMAKLKTSSLNREWTESEWQQHVKQTHVDVELVLENFYSRFDDFFRTSLTMRKQISATLELLEITLDRQRNNLIRLDLHFSIATITVGIGAWMGSLFGMNLTSGLENHPLMFYMVTGGSVATSIGLYLTIVYVARTWMRRNQSLSFIEADDIQLSSAVKPFATLDDVQDIMLKHLDTNPGTAVSKKEFGNMLREVADDVNDNEIDRIFRLFDCSKNGLLEQNDVIQFIINQHGRKTTA